MLPPNVGQEDFAAALTAFRDAVGADWVFTSAEDVALYRDAYSPLWDQTNERVVSAAVAPASVEEVQAVMRTAHRHGIPIYPISTGKNLGYGGSAPNLSGSVVLDLKRMNRIVEVNDKRHFAIVEPGVSYFELYEYIQQNNLQVWIDVPGPGWGSLVGNALDHGVGDTWGHYRNHFSNHCGMEVVLADGTLVRTGMGALPGSDTWAEYPLGFGPGIDGLFAQGNNGIVTKMGFWLMPAPESYYSGTISVPRRTDIIPLIELVNRVEHQGLCGEPAFSCPPRQFQDDPEFLSMTADGTFPADADLDAFVTARETPYWSVKLQFYGPEEVVRAQWIAARRLAEHSLQDAVFNDGELMRFPLSDTDRARISPPDLVNFGIPSLAQFALTARSPWNPKGSDGHLFFTPIIPKSGAALLSFQRLMWDAMGGLGLPRQVGPFTPPNTWFYRSFACISVFLVHRDNPAHNQQMIDGIRKLIKIAAEHGYGEYRAPPVFQDDVRAAYNFNDNALLGVHERIKDALDPQGILAAGRYGVWPKTLRVTDDV